jgi:tetratricopeptide (TPR) repeat protein
MTPRFKSLAGSLAAIVGLAASTAADEVVLIPGSTVKAPGGLIRGQVTAETPTEVKIKPQTGAEQTVPVDQITTVNYDQALGLTQAGIREKDGNLPEAAEQYQKAAADLASKPFLAQAAQFGRARVISQMAMAEPKRLDEALAALDAFVKGYPSSRHLGPALELSARLGLLKGDFDRADKYLADLEKKVPSAANRTIVIKAQIFGKRGKYEDALVAIDKMLGGAEPGSIKWREATLAKASALAGLKKYPDAEAAAKAVIKAAAAEDSETQALAYNTLGDCLRSANKPKDALLAYLHTDLLYSKDKEQHARALSEIAKLWRLLKREDRADEVVERLKQDYPQSPYLSAANGSR